jgi:hypothetical protein
MYTIKNNSIKEIIIKNSKFITLLYKVYSLEDIKNTLVNVKTLYPNATHYCYAYILNNEKKSSDDGEPSGTAGTPILNILESNNLNYILAVVIRYFGGIKLGSSGLIRAYSRSVKEAIKENILTKLIEGINVNITFSWSNIKQIDYLLKDQLINKKEYLDNITYNISIPINILNTLKNYLISYEIIKNINIEK